MSSGDPLHDSVGNALVGRDDDLARLRAFLSQAASGGSSLLISGSPGVGKTALLDAACAAATAEGALVLRAWGVEFEADVGYSALNQLLLPLAADIDRLGRAQRDALSAALGFVEGPGADRSMVTGAVLLLLRRASTVRPLLLVVDDLHWVDRSSAAVLRSLAGTLSGSRLGFLAAYRSGAEGFAGPAGLPVHELEPLDESSAAALIGTRFPMLGARSSQRVLAEAQGNPLALVELPAALTRPQQTGRAALPSVLPLSRRLQNVFAARVSDLPPATRALLLLAALEGTGDLGLLRSARSADTERLDLTDAERARLVVIDDDSGRVTFRHPLVRSSLVALASSADRRDAHRRLAELLADQPERRAWHLAEATVDPDDGVADLLEEVAHRILHRGDSVGAVNALLRAAELSPQPADRSRRLAEAAYVGADITGELRSATRLLGDARRSDPGTGGSLRMAVAAAYVLLNGDGDVDTAHRLLVGAIETGRGDAAAGDTALVEAVQTLLFVCLWGDRAELWNSFHAVMTSLQPDVEPLLDLQVRLMADPVRTARGALADLDAEIAGLSEERDLGRIERIARAGVYVDRIPACREALWRVVADGRRGGAVAAGLNALHLLSVDDFKGGRWDESRRLTDEGLRLCEAHGYALMSLPFRLTQALIAAGRGEYATTQALTEEMFRWATPRGLGGVRMFVSHALTLAALGRGDFDDAYRHASAISPAGTFPPHVAHALVVPLYLVEAAVRTGRHQEAADHVRAMLDAGLPALSPRLALLTAGARAIATPGPGALEAFEEALAVPGAERAPFDLARIQLAYGERLRRARSTTGSRIQLAAAQAAFQRLGARPWADRAGSELRAAGLWTDGSDGGATGVLTPQEQEVAQLAASGLTNRQIAERLLLSHRTVGAHLRQVFPKLGVSSRAGLRDALAAHSRSDGARPTGQAS